MSNVKKLLAARDRADQSFYTIKDIQDVAFLEQQDVPLLDTIAYAKKELVKNHPNARSYNRLQALKNLDSVKTYRELITLMLNTLRAFEDVKINGVAR